MIPEKQSLPLIGRIYEAALDQSRWQAFVEALSDAYSGASVLPIWSEYARRAIFPEQQLASLLSSGELPYVLLGRRRMAGGLLAEVLPAVQRYCEPDRGARVGDAWVLWRCRPG